MPLLTSIEKNILNPIIILLFGVAFVLFVWGGIEFLWGGASDKSQERGRNNLIWGVVGMTIMVCAFGIMQMIIDTITTIAR